MIQAGTKSLADQTQTVQRMLTITGRRSLEEASPDDVVRYLYQSQRTCLNQTLDQYCGQIRISAERSNLPWADLTIWPMLRRGLKLMSTPRKHANPMTYQIFHQILQEVDLELGLASTLAYLAGTRLDEIFRLHSFMITLVKIQDLAPRFKQTASKFNFFLLSTGKESKTGPTDEDDLRFIDVVLLDRNQTASLMALKRAARTNPLFSRRSTLTAALNKHEMGDHSFKGGAANFLTEAIRDEILPATVLPLMLKHKNKTDPIPSVSSGYLSLTGRSNLMQEKKAFDAAVFMRRQLFRDI